MSADGLEKFFGITKLLVSVIAQLRISESYYDRKGHRQREVSQISSDCA